MLSEFFGCGVGLIAWLFGVGFWLFSYFVMFVLDGGAWVVVVCLGFGFIVAWFKLHLVLMVMMPCVRIGFGEFILRLCWF